MYHYYVSCITFIAYIIHKDINGKMSILKKPQAGHFKRLFWLPQQWHEFHSSFLGYYRLITFKITISTVTRCYTSVNHRLQECLLSRQLTMYMRKSTQRYTCLVHMSTHYLLSTFPLLSLNARHLFTHSYWPGHWHYTCSQ